MKEEVQMWSLERPEVLFLFSLVPAGIYFLHFWPHRGNLLKVTFEIWKGEPFKPKIPIVYLSIILARSFFWIAVFALIIAGSGPVALERQRVFMNPGLDIMIVLDESPSMSAHDHGNDSRFNIALNVIENFVNVRENDPIGIVSFADEALLRVPKTLDYSALRNILNKLEVMTLGESTAIGMGLAIALLHLQEGDAVGSVIILITDGENNAGEIQPETAAAMAAEQGVRIYTIGIGNAGDTLLEFTNPQTGQTSRGLYRGRFDEPLLKRIANITSGAYFAAEEAGSLSAAFKAIDSLERVESRTRIEVIRKLYHKEFLILAITLLLLDFIIRRIVLRDVF